ncbi:hypothetical protein LINPERHAP1_LOCUS8750 [Linum perenne]
MCLSWRRSKGFIKSMLIGDGGFRCVHRDVVSVLNCDDDNGDSIVGCCYEATESAALQGQHKLLEWVRPYVSDQKKFIPIPILDAQLKETTAFDQHRVCKQMHQWTMFSGESAHYFHEFEIKATGNEDED